MRGEAVYPLVTEEKHDYASISKTKTFTPPSTDRDFVWAQLVRNLESAFIKLRRHGLRAKSVAIYLRTQDFRSLGMEAALDRPSSSVFEVVSLAEALFDQVYRPGVAYRLTGVVLSKIEGEKKDMQYTLFDDAVKIQAFRAIDHVIDGVNELYGKHALHLGTTLWLGKYRQHLGERGDIAQRKLKLLRGETYRQRLNIPVWNVKV